MSSIAFGAALLKGAAAVGAKAAVPTLICLKTTAPAVAVKTAAVGAAVISAPAAIGVAAATCVCAGTYYYFQQGEPEVPIVDSEEIMGKIRATTHRTLDKLNQEQQNDKKPEDKKPERKKPDDEDKRPKQTPPQPLFELYREESRNKKPDDKELEDKRPKQTPPQPLFETYREYPRNKKPDDTELEDKRPKQTPPQPLIEIYREYPRNKKPDDTEPEENSLKKQIITTTQEGVEYLETLNKGIKNLQELHRNIVPESKNADEYVIYELRSLELNGYKKCIDIPDIEEFKKISGEVLDRNPAYRLFLSGAVKTCAEVHREYKRKLAGAH